MQTAGHQEVPRPLRGGADEHGGLQLDEPLRVEIIPGRLGDPVAQQQVALQIRPPQVEVPVFQPGGLGGGAVLHDFEGGRFRLAQHPQLAHGDFHVAGGDVRVLRGANAHHAPRRQHVLAARGEGLVKRLTGGALVKGQLDDAGAIPQIDEYQLSQIPLPLYPAEHRDLPALVFRPEVPAVRGAFESLDAFCHG